MKVDCHLLPCTKISCKWIKDLKVEPETQSARREVREYAITYGHR